MEEVLEQTYFGNSPGDWLRAAIVAAVTYAALWAIEWVVTRRFAKFAERSRFTFDDVAVAVLRATRFWFTLLVAVWAGSLTLRIDDLLKPGQYPLSVRVNRKGAEVQAPAYVVHGQ